MKRKIMAVAMAMAMAFSAGANEDSALEKTKDVGAAAGRGVLKGLKAAGRGVVKGGKIAGKGVKKAGNWTRDKVEGDKSNDATVQYQPVSATAVSTSAAAK